VSRQDINHDPRVLRAGGLTEGRDDGLWYLASHPGEGVPFRELPAWLQREARAIRRARWLAYLRALIFAIAMCALVVTCTVKAGLILLAAPSTAPKAESEPTR
jgi:hypothetical protein